MQIEELIRSDTFQAIINSIYNAIVVVDRLGKIAVFNDSAEKITGIKRSTALNRSIREMIPNTGLLSVLDTGMVQIGEKIVINGATCVANRTPIYYREDVWGAVSVFNDVSAFEKITEALESYKKLIHKLHALTEELELIFESSNDGLYITDGKGITLRVNSTYEQLTGIKAHEVVGRHMKELVKEGFFSESVTLHVLAQSKPQPVTRLQKLRNGRYVISTGRPVYDKEKNIHRVVTNVRDVTPFLSLAEQLEKTKKHLERYEQEELISRAEILGGEQAIFKSKQMLNVLEMIKQVAPYPTTVLITGESGVGKEIVARMIHANSNRMQGVFVKVNCGAIPEKLVESELFGYEAGAFTGAERKGKPGMVELADRGTLFLDEISELAPDLQVKLLQVIQDQEVTRLGGTASKKIDVRFVAATNQSLSEMMDKGLFRADLYYRLNVVRIDIPPLRQRKEVVPSLVLYFLNKFTKEYGLLKSVSTEAMQCLCRYDWPGNVRELKNVTENLVVMVKEEMILPEHLPDEISPVIRQRKLVVLERLVPLREAVREVEKQLIELALNECGSIRKAAKALDVTHSTLLRKIGTMKSGAEKNHDGMVSNHWKYC